MLEGAEIGIYSGLAAAWYTPERSNDLLFSDPYLDSEIVIVKLKNRTANIQSPADLSGWRLGQRDWIKAFQFEFGAAVFAHQ